MCSYLGPDSGWSFVQVDGAATRVAVGPDHKAWVINEYSQIFRRELGSGGYYYYWKRMPGLGTDVGVGKDGSVWLIGTEQTGAGYGIFHWNESHWTWEAVDGAALRIAVGPDGTPWVVNSNNNIFRRPGGMSGRWEQLPGTARDIGVSADGTVFIVSTDVILNAGSGSGHLLKRFVKGYTTALGSWVSSPSWESLGQAAEAVTGGPPNMEVSPGSNLLYIVGPDRLLYQGNY